MKLGIGSYTYGWAVGEGRVSVLDLIKRASAFRVGVVQICDNLFVATDDLSYAVWLTGQAHKAGVKLEFGARGSRPRHLAEVINKAALLNCDVLRLVIDDRDDQPDVDEVVRRLREAVVELEQADVTLAIENHDRFKARSLVEVIRRVDSDRVGICLDTVNSFGALEGPEVVVDALGPYVACLHLKDFAVTRFPHMQGFTIEGRPLGQGMLDVPWLLARLKSFGRDFNAIIEQWVPPEASIFETIEKERAWAEQSVAAARQWIKD
jgi:3-oxoisoapionate decarboxylase